MREYASLQDAMTATDVRNERPFRCHVHSDHQASASVNYITGLWFCYGCKAKGKYNGTLLRTEDQDLIDLELVVRELQERALMPESMLALYTGQAQYWRTRFSQAAVEYFQLGTDPDTGRATYPIRLADGTLVGVCKRSLDGEGPKYKYPSGFKVSDMLFNYTPEHRSTVYLCEGAPNVIASWEVNTCAFGCYGSNLSNAQIDLIDKVAPTRVAICFDNDRAGIQATRNILDHPRLSQYELVKFPWDDELYASYSDVAELPIELRRTSLDSLHYQEGRG